MIFSFGVNSYVHTRTMIDAMNREGRERTPKYCLAMTLDMKYLTPPFE